MPRDNALHCKLKRALFIFFVCPRLFGKSPRPRQLFINFTFFNPLLKVFHVCALTDDGLIMKSFLCPESTLFDQTVLKCNWWFYTDCKSSKSLYDSNLPVSKSYQLMKSLSYFNRNYKNSLNTTAEVADRLDSIKEVPTLSIITANDQH